jgi:hypothetical protein
VKVTLESDRRIQVRLNGKKNETWTVAAREGTWDFDGLSNRMGDLKKQFPAVDGLTLSARDETEYKDVVKALETIRKTIPAVLLGEF